MRPRAEETLERHSRLPQGRAAGSRVRVYGLLCATGLHRRPPPRVRLFVAGGTIDFIVVRKFRTAGERQELSGTAVVSIRMSAESDRVE